MIAYLSISLRISLRSSRHQILRRGASSTLFSPWSLLMSLFIAGTWHGREIEADRDRLGPKRRRGRTSSARHSRGVQIDVAIDTRVQA